MFPDVISARRFMAQNIVKKTGTDFKEVYDRIVVSEISRRRSGTVEIHLEYVSQTCPYGFRTELSPPSPCQIYTDNDIFVLGAKIVLAKFLRNERYLDVLLGSEPGGYSRSRSGTGEPDERLLNLTYKGKEYQFGSGNGYQPVLRDEIVPHFIPEYNRRK